jgi:molybdopterin-guanine dinucleotide biosynthesis protein A
VAEVHPVEQSSAKLPIHGFVLAGGRSSRMGQDKALLSFRGVPMAETAVTTLTAVCERVSIAGNRDDLAMFAPIAHETRSGIGPVAGIEAGLQSCESAWALFMPVDVPLLPAHFLLTWAQAVLARPATRASYVTQAGDAHPALCLLHKECLLEVSESIEAGKRSVQDLLNGLDGLWLAEAEQFAGPAASAEWFTNINTPEELVVAETSRTWSS